MAAVRVFYMRVMSDETLRPFFEDIDLARLKNKLVSFQTTPSWWGFEPLQALHEEERDRQSFLSSGGKQQETVIRVSKESDGWSKIGQSISWKQYTNWAGKVH